MTTKRRQLLSLVWVIALLASALAQEPTSGVRDDSPAAKAGLKAGDKIVKMAGHEVKNVYDYTYALGEMKAGQEYEVEIVRGSEHLTLKITPAARK